MTKESQKKEWKESWRDDYLKWICGFANADGGTLTIGKNEAWGRGIDKINGECHKHGILKPNYNFEMSGLMITFHANPAHIEAAGSQTAGQGKTSVKTSVKILQLLEANPNLTLADVAEEVGRSLRAIELASSKLVKEGKLRYVGPQKGGHWEVVKKDGEK